MKQAARHRARNAQHGRAEHEKLVSSPVQHEVYADDQRNSVASSRQSSLPPTLQELNPSAIGAGHSHIANLSFFAVTIVIACAVTLGLRVQLNFNAAYIDEADYLFVGRMLWAGQSWPTHTYIFSSDLPLYLLGFGDYVGGVVGGRVISGLCGLVSLYGFYRATLLLFKEPQVAWLAVLLFSLHAPHIFISKFATYDVICLAFFSLSLWMFVTACIGQGRAALLWGIGSGLSFFLAMMSKYIVVVYGPLLFGVAVLMRRQFAWVFALCVMLLSVTYVCYYRSDLTVLYHNQIATAHAANATWVEILGIAGKYLALLAVLWGWTLYRSYTRHGFSSLTILLLLLMGFALPLVGYHLKSRDMISMYKHVVYGAFFLSPAVALLFRDLLQQRIWPRFHVGFASGLLLILMGIGFLQVKEMERAYPDNRPILEWLRPRVDTQTTILSEDPYLFRYALSPLVPNSQMFEVTWFDNDRDEHHSAQDVVDAIWDGKFDYIYLNDVIVPDFAKKLRTEVLPHKYDKILDLPFSTSSVMTPITTGSLSLYKSRERYHGLYPLNR